MPLVLVVDAEEGGEGLKVPERSVSWSVIGENVEGRFIVPESAGLATM